MVGSTSEHRKPHKRRRIVISCTECHRRKQKCDRQYPCCNCTKREKRDLCHYDSPPKDSGPSNSSNGSHLPEIAADPNLELSQRATLGSGWSSENQNQISDFGYSVQSTHNTLGLLRTTEPYLDQRSSSVGLSSSGINRLSGDANRKYRDLVRQLPSPACVDILIQTFFSDVNWQYDILDERPLLSQLDAWRNVTYSDLQAGPGRLSPEIRAFPALLLQILAQALLFHSPHDGRVTSLITLHGMTFHDLGTEYSDTSAEILSLLGKQEITIATIQTGLLRASFLKSSGKVIEAWHALGATIRDAQEIGLHAGRPVSTQNSNIGHRIWIVLHIWDIHMAVVLGRPIATHFQIDAFARTVDDSDQRESIFSHWQTEDPPRPFDVILAGYNVAYKYFPDIHRLEAGGAKPEDYNFVENINATVKKNMQLLPSWCRLEDPDTKFDELPECRWLPIARDGLSSLIHLVVLTLHRPYIFKVANSRKEAFQAGLAILHAQDRLFQKVDLHQCRVFNPVYASFDAIVLVSAVCLASPDQAGRHLAEGVQAIGRSIQRLGMIGRYNPMARSAHAVALSLYHCLKCRTGISGSILGSENSSSNPELMHPEGNFGPTSTSSSELSFDAIMPPHPTHDLFYNHVSSSQVPSVDTTEGLTSDWLLIDPTGGWDFEGAFSDTSFWSFMNDLNFHR